MSQPAVGSQALFYNPVGQVARLLNERHGNKYLVLNVSDKQDYITAPFFHRHSTFPIQQDGIPSLEGLVKLCTVLERFLKADPDHLLAVHSTHGQGRTNLVI